MKRIALFLVLLVVGVPCLAQQQTKRPMAVDDLFKFKRVSDPNISPDGKLVVVFDTSDSGALQYEVSYDGKPILAKSRLGLELQDAPALSERFRVVKLSNSTHDETWTPVYGERSSIRDHYNQLIVDLDDSQDPPRRLQVIFRAYDEGIAFCYVIPKRDGWERIHIAKEKRIGTENIDLVQAARDDILQPGVLTFSTQLTAIVGQQAPTPCDDHDPAQNEEHQRGQPRMRPSTLVQRLVYLIAIDARHQIPGRIGYGSQFGQDRLAAIVDSLDLTYLAKNGPYRGQPGLRERKAHGQRGTVVKTQRVEE